MLRGYGSTARSRVVVTGQRREFIDSSEGSFRLRQSLPWWDVFVMAYGDPNVGPYIEGEASAEPDDLPDWIDWKATRPDAPGLE